MYLYVFMPFRVSLIGGGSDLPVYLQARYRERKRWSGGRILTLAIQHGIWLEKAESSKDFSKDLDGFKRDKAIPFWFSATSEAGVYTCHYAYEGMFSEEDKKYTYLVDSCLPLASGLGGSSALASALMFLSSPDIQEKFETADGKLELVKRAAHLEIDLMGMDIGIQDHIATVYGGYRRIKINMKRQRKKDEFPFAFQHRGGKTEEVPPADLSKHLFLLGPLGELASSTRVLRQFKKKQTNFEFLDWAVARVNIAFELLRQKAWADFWELMQEYHERKNECFGIKPPEIPETIRNFIENYDFKILKICGAGHRGFLLLLHIDGFEIEKDAAALVSHQYDCFGEGRHYVLSLEGYHFLPISIYHRPAPRDLWL